MFVPEHPRHGHLVKNTTEAVELLEHLWRNGAWTQNSRRRLIHRLSGKLLYHCDWYPGDESLFTSKRRLIRRGLIVLHAPRNRLSNLPDPRPVRRAEGSA